MIKEIFLRLQTSGSLKQESLTPCSGEDIVRLEQLCAAQLPNSYEEFMRLAGRGAGRLFSGSQVYFPDVLGLHAEAIELLEENNDAGLLPPNAMVFYMHQGYEFCFFLPGAADPEVFQYIEGQAGITCPWSSFSSFLEEAVSLHLKQWSDLNA